MSLSGPKIHFGELNDTPLGNLRLAASDLGLLAVEWAESQPALDSYLERFKRPLEANAEILWLGVRVERRLGDRNSEASYALQLRNRFPESKEARSLATGEN